MVQVRLYPFTTHRSSSTSVQAVNGLFLVVASLMLAGCKPSPMEHQADPPAVATIDGEVILAEVLEEDLRRFRREHGQLAFRSETDLETIRRHLLDQAVERVLVRRTAEELGISIDDEAVERAILRRRSAYPDRTFEEYLVETGIPLSSLREEMRYRLLLQELFSREVNPRVVVTDEEIEEHYEKDPSAWALEEQVRARQIVVRTDDEATRLARRIRRGEDFAELAARYSLGPEGEQGGELGWFTRGTMPPPIDDVCFSLPTGRLSEVVESPYGFHIFQVMERREERPRSLSEVSRTIAGELRLQKEHEAQRAYIAGLREAAEITVFDNVLAEVR